MKVDVRENTDPLSLPRVICTPLFLVRPPLGEINVETPPPFPPSPASLPTTSPSVEFIYLLNAPFMNRQRLLRAAFVRPVASLNKKRDARGKMKKSQRGVKRVGKREMAIVVVLDGRVCVRDEEGDKEASRTMVEREGRVGRKRMVN